MKLLYDNNLTLKTEGGKKYELTVPLFLLLMLISETIWQNEMKFLI